MNSSIWRQPSVFSPGGAGVLRDSRRSCRSARTRSAAPGSSTRRPPSRSRSSRRCTGASGRTRLRRRCSPRSRDRSRARSRRCPRTRDVGPKRRSVASGNGECAPGSVKCWPASTRLATAPPVNGTKPDLPAQPLAPGFALQSRIVPGWMSPFGPAPAFQMPEVPGNPGQDWISTESSAFSRSRPPNFVLVETSQLVCQNAAAAEQGLLLGRRHG